MATLYLYLLVVIRITVYVVSYFNEESSLSHFLSFTMDPMSIGMMILGIISIYGFLPQSIKLGATRKAFYLGIVYTVLALTISYAVLNLILTATEYAVVQRFTIESIALSDIWHYLITLFLSFLFG
ncbi:hypothetical protein [Piscibacillus salipiscarius]|uniref:hypothetical protein n=1 Tax=Piscibacillus salipiscarius TaxID=299480 RepID=UPI0006D2BB89|nr:hypothetical protein [Piscibacillus salipiscarius]